MFVRSEHLFFVGFVVEQAVQFGRYFVRREVVCDAFFNDFPSCDNIDECEMADGEKERLRPPTDEPDESRAGQMINGYLRAS